MKEFKDIFDHKKAFIAYLTAGQVSLSNTEKSAHALVQAGVDILEIGLPFSDPIADGPVIQDAMFQSLKNKNTIDDVFLSISNIKEKTRVPIVLFTYLNPLLAYGFESVAVQAHKAGINSFLIVDLPLEHAKEYQNILRKNNIDMVGLISPTTNKQRVINIDKNVNSFLYYACRNGTTGVRHSMPLNYNEKVINIKSVTNNPLVCGFGIGSKSLARQAIQYADGFVVGSAFVGAISRGAGIKELKKMAKNIDPRGAK